MSAAVNITDNNPAGWMVMPRRRPKNGKGWGGIKHEMKDDAFSFE